MYPADVPRDGESRWTPHVPGGEQGSEVEASGCSRAQHLPASCRSQSDSSRRGQQIAAAARALQAGGRLFEPGTAILACPLSEAKPRPLEQPRASLQPCCGSVVKARITTGGAANPLRRRDGVPLRPVSQQRRRRGLLKCSLDRATRVAKSHAPNHSRTAAISEAGGLAARSRQFACTWGLQGGAENWSPLRTSDACPEPRSAVQGRPPPGTVRFAPRPSPGPRGLDDEGQGGWVAGEVNT